MSSVGFLDPVALALLNQITPSGTLAGLVDGNPELDALQSHADALQKAARALDEPSFVDILEDDFAQYVVPAFIGVAPTLEAWAIPILSALVGPGAPLLSVGLTFACHVAILALTAWAAKRLAAEAARKAAK